MLELQRIREDHNQMIESLKKRGVDFSESINRIITLDELRRTLQGQMDQTKGELNKLSKEIGSLFQSGKQEEANLLKAKTGDLKKDVENFKTQLEDVEKRTRRSSLSNSKYP